jgi:hypothetical protein
VGHHDKDVGGCIHHMAVFITWRNAMNPYWAMASFSSPENLATPHCSSAELGRK